MNKLFLLVVASLMFSGIVSAALTDLGTFGRGDDILIVQLCADCTYNNITSITYPNSSEVISDVAMTQAGTKFTYEFDGNYTTPIGQYTVNGVGDLDGEDTIWAYNFEVTPNGFKDTLGFTFIILLLSLGVIALGFNMSDHIIMLFGSFGLYFLGLYSLLYGLAGIMDTVTTMSFSILTLGIAAYVSTRASYEIITNQD